MRWRLALLLVATGCHPSSRPVERVVDDPHPHKAVVAGLVKPLMDGEYATGLVVGLYDAGKVEIYGFGKGPGNRPPDGATLFEIGSVTRVFTSLLLADSVQRQEVTLTTDLADLLPPGVTVPTGDHRTITLGELATHTSGLPLMPASLAARADAPDPFAKYGEDALYNDLVHARLVAPPGATVVESSFGTGLLGFALGRKIGIGYGPALLSRVLSPLGLGSTYLEVPEAAKFRRTTGTNSDLVPVAYWYFDALAGEGALISDAHDMLELINAELDAASGSKLPLRAAMRLSQENQFDHPTGDNAGLGWQIDSAGRYWQSGQTGGFHAFVGFDPKTRRGVVVLASTALSVLDHLAIDLFRILSNEQVPPTQLPTAAQLQAFVGTYALGDEKVSVVVKGKRMYILGRGAPPYRMVPISDHEAWIEQLHSVVGFQRNGDKIVGAVFVVAGRQFVAMRVDDPTPAPTPPAPAPTPPAPAPPAPKP